MKTFKILLEELTIILESKIDDIKQKYKSINVSHDPYGEFNGSALGNLSDTDEVSGTDKDKLIDHIHSFIPEGNSNLLDWTLDKYHKGQFKQEDLSQISKNLHLFNLKRNELDKKQIKHYNTVGELNAAVEKYKTNSNSTLLNTDEKNKIINDGSTLIHDSPDMKIYKLHGAEDNEETPLKAKGREACKLLGSSSWCISNENNEENLFGSTRLGYNKPTYIIHFPNAESHEIKKIGYGIGTDQFQDERNNSIESEDIEKLVKKYPKLKEIPDFQGDKWELTKDKNAFIDKNINTMHKFDTKKYIDHPEINENSKNKLRKLKDDFERAIESNDSKELDRYKNHPNSNVRLSVAKNENTHPNTLHEMRNDSDRDVRWNIAQNNNTHPDTLHDMRNDESKYVRWYIAMHPNTHPNTLHDMRNDENEYIRGNIANNKNTHPDTLHEMRNDEDEGVRWNITNHPNTRSDTLHDMRNDSDRDVRKNIAENNNTHPDTLHEMRNDEDEGVRWYIAKNKNTYPDTLHDMRNDESEGVRWYIAKNLRKRNLI